jgi:maltose-binding protein MalE
VLVEGAVTMVNKTAEQTFANERSAFAFNGSWGVNVYKGMNPGLEYGAILPPMITDKHPMRIWGGAGTSFVVNEKSPRKQEAIKFLRWLTEDKQQAYLAETTNNLPANRRSIKDISPILAEFADDLERATHPNIYPAHEIPTVSESFQKGIQSILIGEKTPEQVAQEVQRIKEKEQVKLRPAA